MKNELAVQQSSGDQPGLYVKAGGKLEFQARNQIWSEPGM
jgi:hypothetical protein